MRFTDRERDPEQVEERRHNQFMDGEEKEPPSTAGLRDRIAHFTWPWFACTMSTGAVAVVIGQTPNKFPGLQTIGKIFFIVDLVLFVLFTALITMRFILVPRKLVASLHHPTEGLFFGAFWVSISLILNCTQTYGVPSCGPWLVKALEVCFWTYCAIVLLVATFQYYIFFQKERLNVPDAMPAWIFPVYPLLVIGLMAGTFIPSQPHGAAYPMWVGAVMLQGLAWTVAMIIYPIYMQRLMTSSLPGAPTRPGMYISVGPAGYTSAGLISLGSQASKVLPPNVFSSGSTPDGDIVSIIGTISGIFLVLFAFWFFCISTVAVVAGIKRMAFTLNWWAFVFPNAGFTLAVIQAGRAFQSPGINGVSSALTILLVFMWLLTATFHIRAIYRGTILWPGKDEDKSMSGIKWGWHAFMIASTQRSTRFEDQKPSKMADEYTDATLYFGYGSNLWKQQMHQRCPTSKFLGIARLNGYRWIINERGYANVVGIATEREQAPLMYRDEVWGLVYSLQADDEDRLDRNEGVPFAYTKEDLKVDFWRAKSGKASDVEEKSKQVEMLVYINRELTSADKPKKEYIHRMNMGITDAEREGMPKEYVDKVMRKFIPEEKDSSVAKAADKQALVFENGR
ncbi:hypothetical protein LTR08_004880 [Meristemomyces frigidus]|nr:hypothetical protein LTR08_004880 [Meristemomyces frigidus]